jgi:hypothetical protein
MSFENLVSDWRKLLALVGGLEKLFVIGCGKSGTNWLKNILHGHDEIVIMGEGRFFWSLAPRLAEAVNGFNDSLPWKDPSHIAYLRQVDFQLLLRTIIDSQLARYVADGPVKPRLRIVGDKTPMHTLAVEDLNRLYPAARFIQIVRDPRDAAASQWLFWAQRNDGRSLEEFVRYSITHVWPLNVRSAREAGSRLGDRYTEVRYEDLHRDEEGEIRRLLRFLGVDAGERSVRQCAEAGRFERWSGGRARGEESGASLYRRGVVGDWIHHLPAAVVHESCGQVGELMREFGYDPEAAPCAGVAAA